MNTLFSAFVSFCPLFCCLSSCLRFYFWFYFLKITLSKRMILLAISFCICKNTKFFCIHLIQSVILKYCFCFVIFFFLFGRHLCLNLHWVWQLRNGEMTRAKKLTMNITSVGNQSKSTLIQLGRKVMVKTFVITLYLLYSDEYDFNF